MVFSKLIRNQHIVMNQQLQDSLLSWLGNLLLNSQPYEPTRQPFVQLVRKLTIKLANSQPAHCYEPTSEVLETAKS